MAASGSSATSRGSATTTLPLPVQWDVAQQDPSRASHVAGHRRRLVDRALPFQQSRAPHRSALRWLSFGQLRRPGEEAGAEWNVGCESCHGPGGAHAAKPSRANIFSAAQRGWRCASTDTCLAGPLTGTAAQGPDRRQGLRLAGRLPRRARGCRTTGSSRRTRPVRSTFTQLRGRHRPQEPHAGQRLRPEHHVSPGRHLLRRVTTRMALRTRRSSGNRWPPSVSSCHAPGSANGPQEPTLEAHTHHANNSAGSDCVACHMQRANRPSPTSTCAATRSGSLRQR